MYYTIPIQLRFIDFDTQIFVNHSNICTFIEHAYLNFVIDHIDPNWNFSRLPLVLRREQTEYLIPIEPSAQLVCKLIVTEVQKRGFTVTVFVVDQKDNQKVYSKGTRDLIHIDMVTHKSQNIDETIKDKLLKFTQPDVNF